MVRAFSALLALGAVAFASALMLSDRAPGLFRRLFGDAARRLWERIDATQRAQFVQDQRSLVEEVDAGPDFLVHVAMWAVVMLLIALAVWSWRGLIVTAFATFAGSVAVELAQGRYTDTRTMEQSDIVANAVGVAAGAAVAALLYLAWHALGIGIGSLFPQVRSAPVEGQSPEEDHSR